MMYQINLKDPRTGATSPIDCVEAPSGYTADDYIRECKENADSEWYEMLKKGVVTIDPIDD